MKKLLFFFVILFSCFQLSAQSVGINNNGTPPDSSAILDIKSSNKGVLLPRIFLTGLYDSATINKPAISLLVFNINTNLRPGGAGYYAWNGKSWDLILSTSNVFIEGKNKFITEVDGDARQYLVHVPESYSNAIQTPVVFMLHGTAQTGENMYDKSGWKEIGEEENILTVFPTSWRYCIDNQGAISYNTTKWNTPPDSKWVFCALQTPRDDIKFLKKIITELRAKFNVDTTRIYMVGFSNGGEMSSKCSIKMSDKLAAVISNASTFEIDTTYIPVRKLPVMFQLGNDDYGPGNTGPGIPLNLFDTLLKTPGTNYYKTAHLFIKHFGVDSVFTMTGNTASAMIANYPSPNANPLNIFRFVLVKDLKHMYPNGDNHWMEAARLHWLWLKQYAIP